MATAAEPLPQHTLTTTLQLDLAHVESGVPLATIADFVASSGVPLKDIYAVVIPARTLKHRRDRKEPLSRDESDKLARLVRVYDHAVKVFESPERALRWLNSPKHRFDERTPMQLLNTEVGARSVEEFLGQIDYGIFA
jgi:putative toxin-antitoxin system antitoxin component (TIGR02293 family)